MKNALVILAVLICVAIAFGHTPSNSYKQAECTKISQSNIAVSRRLNEVNERIAEASKKEQSEYKDQRDFAVRCSDLAAQWSVANVTHRGFWLGLIGLGFLAWTLFETRKATQAAADAASTANKTLAEAQEATRVAREGADAARDSVEIAKSQVRPFLTVNKAYVWVFRVGFPLEVRFEIKNFGDTPATLRGVRPYVIVKHKNVTHTIQRVREQFTDIIPPTGSRYLIGKSEQAITQDDFDRFIKGDIEFRAVISMIFSDQYGVWRDYFFSGLVKTDGINRNDTILYTLAEESNRPEHDYIP